MSERLSRADRRQCLKDDAPWIGKPINLAAMGRALEANTRHLALLLLERGTAGRASQAADYAATVLDASLAQVVAQAVGEPAACRRGCFHCCHTYVSAMVPDILRLARMVKTNAPMMARVRGAAVRAREIPQSERNTRRVSCPILESDFCGVYAARPLVCRALLSRSVEACMRAFGENADARVPHVGSSVEIHASIALMLQAALKLSGLAHHHYELTQGLAAALEHEDAEERWLAGEPVFAGVARDEAERAPTRLSVMVDRLVEAIRPSL